ncbi:MAG TPA: nucleotidyl transferase AbiEii/AbiGii toxin family protein, partial [bacterium]|nr:nucleotidyl transferase AbiEii/AbiGii toxin family protein [bacterium]
MHDKVLPRGSRRLLDSLEAKDPDLLADWVLAGGTGLALQLGHRRSEDFDFFRNDTFDVPELSRRMSGHGKCEMLRQGDRDLTVLLDGVKLSFFQVPEPFLHA